VEQGEFRMDLFYRLNVFPIEVPPLRERVEDVPALVRRFVSLLEEEQRGSLADRRRRHGLPDALRLAR
jgi:sigma-54 specific flagellar transcriptional regulator A